MGDCVEQADLQACLRVFSRAGWPVGMSEKDCLEQAGLQVCLRRVV